MKQYLVGGAVRDMLMGIEPKDRDYVVVGSTPEMMLADGYEQVGADFPVFLKDGSEYALARREKKTGTGYLGFTSEFGADVTLEDDLARRDLTINSMAFEAELDNPGSFLVHDYFGGKDDIHAKVLRHTSNAFAEDPVRVLRLARFRARLGAEWTLAPETVRLVTSMGRAGVLHELTAERVWKELSRALVEPAPRLFFDTLLEADVLHILFPEVYALKSALEHRKWHPEGDAYEHTMLVLTQSAVAGNDLTDRLAALTHDFGKGLTTKDKLPNHFGHEDTGVPVVEAFCNRLTVPARMRDQVMHLTEYHMHMHLLGELKSRTFVKMYMGLGAWRDTEMVDRLHRLGVSDTRGKLGHENDDVSALGLVQKVWDAVKVVTFADVFPNGETKPEKIKEGLYRARIRAAGIKLAEAR
jgi:tRNA nucleotidyltransferase (CCA-adding enzyme)